MCCTAFQRNSSCRAIDSKMSILDSSSRYVWCQATTAALIDLYKNYPVLYMIRHPDYKCKTKRLEALDHIRIGLIKRGKGDVSIEDIKRKIHGLRTQYANQLSKMKNQQGKGQGEYKPKLWCFPQLDFLRHAETAAEEIDYSEEHTTNQYFHDIEESIEINVKQEQETPSGSKPESPNYMTISDPEDDIYTFGKLVELELRKITDSRLVRKAKKEILNILMDAQENCENPQW